MQYRAVVFDMDGTILNTLEDLTASLNHALEETGHRHDFSGQAVGCFFGSGARVAAARALRAEAGETPEETLEDAPEPPGTEAVFSVFKKWYPLHCEERTCPYPGIPELLRSLREKGFGLAVVSNKLDGAVQALCETHFPGLFDAALGEKEPERRRKPAPDMVLAALERLGVSPEEAVLVGDSEIDLLTAAAAGTDCVAVAWGFRSRDFLRARGAERIIDAPRELEALLQD